jgi:hypothetical protein
MSGLIKFKFGFENSLKFGFEKLEKEKKERNFFSSRAVFSYRSPQLGLPPRARPAYSRALLPLGPSPSRGQPARHRARLRPAPNRRPVFPLSRRHAGPTCQRRVSFSFFFLRLRTAFLSLSPIR